MKSNSFICYALKFIIILGTLSLGISPSQANTPQEKYQILMQKNKTLEGENDILEAECLSLSDERAIMEEYCATLHDKCRQEENRLRNLQDQIRVLEAQRAALENSTIPHAYVVPCVEATEVHRF